MTNATLNTSPFAELDRLVSAHWASGGRVVLIAGDFDSIQPHHAQQIRESVIDGDLVIAAVPEVSTWEALLAPLQHRRRPSTLEARMRLAGALAAVQAVLWHDGPVEEIARRLGADVVVRLGHGLSRPKRRAKTAARDSRVNRERISLAH